MTIASKAWRGIGEAFEQYAATGVHELVKARHSATWFGLCFAVRVWPGIPARVRRSMRKVLLIEERQSLTRQWRWGKRRSAYLRAMYCYFLAEESTRR